MNILGNDLEIKNNKSLAYDDCIPKDTIIPRVVLSPKILPMNNGTDSKQYSLNEALQEIGSFGTFQQMLLFLCAFGYFAVCAEMLVFVFVADPLMKEWGITRATFSWIPFVGTLCNLIGGLAFGTWSDHYGRQYPFVISIWGAATMGFISAFASSLTWMLIFRGMTSFFLGGISAIDFVLFLECVSNESRGKTNILITMAGALGVLFVAGIAWIVVPNFGWRYLLGSISIPCFLVGAVRFCVTQESPRYLLTKGKKEQAHQVLTHIAAVNGAPFNISMDQIQLSRHEIITPTSTQSSFHAIRCGLVEMFGPRFRRRTILMMVIWFCQFSGYWGLTVYLPAYLRRLSANHYLTFFLMVLAEIPGLFVAFLLVDRVSIGRKWTLRIFLLGSFIFTTSLSFFDKTSIVLSIISMMIYFCVIPSFAVLFTYTPELFPTHIRGFAGGLMHCISALPGLIVPFISAWILGLKTDWLYGIVWGSLFAIGFTASCFLHEDTTRKSLDHYLHEEELGPLSVRYENRPNKS